MRVKIKSHHIVLDVGCGTGLLMQYLSRTNRGLFLIGIDSSIAMLREAKKKLADFELVLADCDHMPFKDMCCDLAFSISVFQLLDEPRRSLAETVRLLKKDGDFAITILRKSKDAFCLNNIRDANIEVYDSETMKDVFLIGRRTVVNDGEDVTAI
jgi:ubiquinone/menaquinone biosynthesis C-methylase UbiE